MVWRVWQDSCYFSLFFLFILPRKHHRCSESSWAKILGETVGFQPEDCQKQGPLGARESQGKSKDEKAGEGNPLVLNMNYYQSQTHSWVTHCTIQTQRIMGKVLKTKLWYKSLPKEQINTWMVYVLGRHTKHSKSFENWTDIGTTTQKAKHNLGYEPNQVHCLRK